MNNKGFIYVETIVTVVILLATLISVYSIYSKVIIKEKDRLYYDDISKIYTSLAIRDVLSDTLNDDEFNRKVEESNSYVTFFDYNNDNLFYDKQLFETVRNYYNIERFAYVKISDIDLLKTCIIKKVNNSKCQNTINNISYYGTTNMNDYIQTLDIPNEANQYENHMGILLVIIKETKNGYEKKDDGVYKECLQNQVLEYNGIETSNEAEIRRLMSQYYADKNISFNMSCENIEYLTWVFL